MGKFQYGGQAVIEGVMMRGPSSRSVAVRSPNGDIVIDEKEVGTVNKRSKFLKLPMVRGVIALWESLIMGMEALSFSANQSLGEEEELTKTEMVITILVSFGIAALFFVALPTGAAHLTKDYISNVFLQNIIEGIVRLVIFVAYVFFIGLVPDIKRVFAYHGAEHKVINAFEAGEKLEPSLVKSYGTFHPRCGTSFIFIVLIMSIFVFSLLGDQSLWLGIILRLILLPVLAGLSYELLKLSAKHIESKGWCVVSAPGRWMQSLTTNEPTEEQLEVAIAAFNAVYKDGKEEEVYVK